MSSSNRLQNNVTRLNRLLTNQGAETMRKYFDSIHPPATLTVTLNAHRGTLQRLRRTRVIKPAQMRKLFPPAGMPPTTSKKYDITLLFILIRNICGLSAPPSTAGSWDMNPAPHDTTPQAELVRIKNYRNELYGHNSSTEVSDADFNTYWSEISGVLVRLSLVIGLPDPSVDILYLKTCSLDEDRRVVQFVRNGIPVLCFLLFLYSHFWKENYPHSQNFSDPGFVGRDWVFRELENISYSNKVCGVHLVTDPGWGKTAIMKRLINSPSSSAVIHENIIGYHFCKFNDKRTRDGKRFVKILVQSIAKKISEFRVQLESNCTENLMECFQKAIVDPLRELNGTGRNVSFILIDALDECLEREERHNSIILKILCRSVPDLPNWVKLIVTSRKLALTTSIVSKIDRFLTLEIGVEDQRNEQDLRTYATKAIFAQTFRTETPIEEKLRLNHLIELALESCKGHFLYLETIIKLWQKYPHKMNAQSIPESLTDMYITSFAKRFNESDFDHFEPLLEVLLAANSPPTLLDLENILDVYNQSYNTREIAEKLSEFFKSDIDQEPLEFHHQNLAEWLTNQTNGTYGIFIQKSRGHQYIVDYLFHFYNVNERQTNLTFKELSELCIHILHAAEKEIDVNVRKLSSLNVSDVRDHWKRCILHDLASKTDATKIITAVIKQFNCVDIPDYGGLTPAIYAAIPGSYENVKLFIDNGANVNHAVKRASCVMWDYIRCSLGYSMSFIAALKGHTKIAKLLVTSGAEIDKASECGWKPLYLAAAMGHLEIVQLYINNGAQPDTISLHHATARNHTEIVRFLLNRTGLRDTCLPCKPGDESWCVVNFIRFHHCICETALYAAVSRDNLEIAKLILEYGNASVNCKHGFGRTALMEAISRKNVQMVEVLISAGANVDEECEMSLTLTQLFYAYCVTEYEVEEKYLLYGSYCDQPVCSGYRVIDFSVAHGLWKIMIPLIPKGKLDAYSSDNATWSLATVAGIYDQVDFINATYGNRINSIPHIETTLRYVAICHSVKILKHLLNSGNLSKLTSVYEDGKTLLHFATLGSSKRETDAYVTKSCASSACVCPNKTGADIVDQKRLETVMLLTKVLTSEINKQDKYGRTALHYAAVHVLPKIVEVLVNAGADWSIKDQRGDTALEFALREKHIGFIGSMPCRLTSDKVFRVCQSTIFDEMASYLLQNATIKKCDMRAKKLLDGLIYHKLSLSLYALFKSGLDVNCAREHFRRHLSELWEVHYEILEVFKIFEINVEVLCDASFSQSELHLMAFSRTFVQVGNLFQPSVNGSSFPLQRFITNHPKGVDILNECYDKEGYLAIHRAIQGDNFDAFSWFIEIGVDVLKKTRSGFTALALATRMYPFETKRRIFEILLENAKEKKSPTSFYCNTELTDLSPLHVAGSQGMKILEIIHRKMPELPLNCTNSDGIQPIYLAYLYHAVHSISSEDERAFQNLGLSLDREPSAYPKREAEYHLIYNQLFYRTLIVDLRNVLNHEGLFECPGINELLPHKTVIKEYIKQRACATRCWQFAFEASRAFSSNFPYLDIQNNISNPFTDRFIDIVAHMAELRFHLVKLFHFNSFNFISISTREKNLWRKVTKTRSCAHNCSCFETMLLLQEKLTSEPRAWGIEVDKRVAKRMGWTDTSREGDVLYRWPFSFLLKKALRTDQAYKYLEILS